MATEALNQGTVEFLIIDVTDALGNLTTLAGTTPQYQVYYNGTVKQAYTNCQNINLMRVYCLIDTTGGGGWAVGTTYEIYLKFVTAPETPIVGPFPFSILAVPA